MQKAARDKFIAENQPSSINQVLSTGMALDEASRMAGKNPFTAVARLYDKLEEKEIKQAMLEE